MPPAALKKSHVTNHATASAGGTTSNQSEATLDASLFLSMSLPPPGSTLFPYTTLFRSHYSYDVKNTGNVSLVGPVTVSDDRTTVTCPDVSTVGNHDEIGRADV